MSTTTISQIFSPVVPMEPDFSYKHALQTSTTNMKQFASCS